MTRESPYRIHRELAETRQRPHAPPQPPAKRFPVYRLLAIAIALIVLAAGWSFMAHVSELFWRIG